MERLVRRGEEIARRKQHERVLQVADRVKEILGNASVEGSRIAVSGRGLVRRWLADSRLRFLASDLR
jgi:hypothetical protein